jgi:hypothetical protein
LTSRLRFNVSELAPRIRRKRINRLKTQLDQVMAVEEYLRTKYTNEELYSWMEGQTKYLYQQAYNLAYDLAKRTEKGFKFERPQNTTEYI